MFRWLLLLVVLLALAAGGAYFVAGRAAPPQLAIDKPDRLVGQNGTLEVTADAPNARFTSLVVTVEQNGKSIPLFTLGAAGAAVTQIG